MNGEYDYLIFFLLLQVMEAWEDTSNSDFQDCLRCYWNIGDVSPSVIWGPKVPKNASNVFATPKNATFHCV